MKAIPLWILKHSRQILTGISAAGVVVTAVLSAKAYPLAQEMIHEATAEKGEPLTTLEKVRAGGKAYLPAVAAGAVTIAAGVGGAVMDGRQIASLAGMLAASETASAEYRQHVAARIGPEQERDIREEIAMEHATAKLSEPNSVSAVISTGDGDDLMFDDWSGRVFRSSLSALETGVANFNNMLVSNMYGSMNELYAEWHLPDVGGGIEVGFTVDKPARIGHRPGMIGDKSCIVVYMEQRPEPQYWKTW